MSPFRVLPSSGADVTVQPIPCSDILLNKQGTIDSTSVLIGIVGAQRWNRSLPAVIDNLHGRIVLNCASQGGNNSLHLRGCEGILEM